MSATRKQGRATSGQAEDRRRAAPAGKDRAPEERDRRARAEAPDSQEEEARARRAAQRAAFAGQFVPYLVAAIGIFLSVCFIMDAVRFGAARKDHLMGPVGYWIVRILYGLFSWVAYLIPAALFHLAFARRIYRRERTTLVKGILTVVILALLSSAVHVSLCALGPKPDTGRPDLLFEMGATFESGGVIGGLIGFVLYRGLRLAGSIALLALTIPLVFMALFGVTPSFVIGKIRAHRVSFADARVERRRRAARRRRETAALKEREREEAARSRREDDRVDDRDEDRDDRDDGRDRVRGGRRRREDARDEPDDQDDRDDRNDRNSWDDREDREDRGDREDRNDRAGRTERTERGGDGRDRDREDRWDRRDRRDREDRDREDRRRDRYDRDDLEDREDREDRDETSRETRRRADRRKGAPVDPRESGDPIMDPDALPEGPVPPLPLHDRARGAGAPGGGRRERGGTASARAAEPDETDPEDEETDRMRVSMDEDLDPDEAFPDEPDPYADPDPDEEEVSYDVVDASGERIRSGGTGPYAQVVVHVNPSDPTAVTERGLPDEETAEAAPAAAAVKPEEPDPEREYRFPPIDILAEGVPYETHEGEIAANTLALREILKSFHIEARSITCSCGPTITRFEVKPESGIRVRSIAALVDDIALGLAKSGVRIEAPIPGKGAVGIEVPNDSPATVYLRTLLETPEFRNHKSRLAAGLGADVSGRPVIFDIHKMPHLLIAGATGMGKSVCINSILISILYKAKPEEVKFILIDPKKVEFTVYRGLPHLYAPIVNDPKKAAGALYSAVNEMRLRYEMMEEVGARESMSYNALTANDPDKPYLPQILIVIDELADLMMSSAGDVETAVCRLAQMGRAAGIHLIIGTQRPSVDVITGLIKANIPSRIAFTVASQVDSRTIIDSIGAEKLIGRGDMLYAPVGPGKPIRVQGAYVSDREVEDVVTFIKEENGTAVYNERFTKDIDIETARCAAGKRKPGEQPDAGDFDDLMGEDDGEDPKFWKAVEVCVVENKVSTSLLQRRLNLGYGRAAKIIDRMFELGFAGQADGNKARKVLITENELRERRLNRDRGPDQEDPEEDLEEPDDF